MTDIDFPAWVKVTRCKSTTATFFYRTRHGIIRQEVPTTTRPFVIGIVPSTGRVFPSVVTNRRSLAPTCGPTCINARMKL